MNDRCADASTVGCEDPYSTYQALLQEVSEINTELATLDKTLQDLIDAQDELDELLKEFCEDPGEFAADCLATV